MIIARYITKEVLYSFLAVTIVLLLVALSNSFINLLAKVATGQLPTSLVFKVIGLYIPEFIALLMPLGVFIAILFAHGRLHADSEMAVLFTSGFNWSYITKVTLMLAFVIAGCGVLLTTWVNPKVTAYREELLVKGEAVGVLQSIMPGQFQVLDGGRLVFYVEDVGDSSESQLTKVFIAEQPQLNSNALTLITAQRGAFEQTNKEQSFFLTLADGYKYTGIPGELDYAVINFKEYGRTINREIEQLPDFDKASTTIELWNSSSPSAKAELQWRIALPVSILILALLAIPLAQVSPRQGRFGKFLPAILLYIAYHKLMTVACRLVDYDTLTFNYVIWLVHIGFLLLAWVLLARVSGRLSQFLQEYVRST